MVPSKSRGRGEALAAVGPSLHIDPMWRFLFLALAPVAAHAGPFAGTVADVYVLGEVHDNPVHHAAQADAIRDIEPRAVVFEMLTQAQADEVRDDRLGDPEALGALLGWEEAGWPDFSMYYPIFAASRGAQVFGAAVPREAARAAMEVGVARSFGEGAADYGLEEALEAEELADRLNLQLDAHCGKLPTEMLPMMVDLQRLRDATLARVTIEALDETGGPVAVITGNGHAREDWGVPSYIARVRPQILVLTLGQGEDGGEPEGGFDAYLSAPAVEREDPCAVFDE
ncbi:putative iron-regulated protein [Maritimibacter alkaliphilus HTCC2654]|nr:putative iron-regulated protein [Maritimibacter alkaliphilus HTCC2654]